MTLTHAFPSHSSLHFSLSFATLFFCLVGITTQAHAAVGDITAVRISNDTALKGWAAEIDIEGLATGGTYDMGLGANNDPSTAKLVLTLTSPGYDASGNATTLTRTVYGTQFVRKPYPDSTTSSSVADESSNGGTLTVKVALSEFIYSGDTSITATIASGFYTKTSVPNNAVTAHSVTNNSTLAYPKTIGHFVVEQRRPVNGTQTVEVIAVQKFARNGKPVAAVTIPAVGATSGHTETATTTAMVLSSRGDNIPVYAVDLDLSTAAGFTRGELVNISFTAYPWVGDSSATLDATADAGTHSWELGPLKWTIIDKMIAVVASSGGNDTTCVASTLQATADAGTPCATINGALTKIAAANNTSFSLNRIDGGEVQVKAGTWQTGKYSTQTNTNGYFTITPHSSTNQAGVVFDSSYLNNQNQYTYQRYYNVTFNRSSNVYIVNGGTNTVLIMEKVNFADAQGAWYAGGSVGATTNLEVLDSTTSNAYFTTGGNSQHSRLNRNNTYTNPTGAAGSIVGDAQCVIGLKGTGSVKPIWTLLNSLDENNIIVAYTKWLAQADNLFILGQSSTNTITNMAIFNNLVERIGSSATPISEISVGNHANILLWHNTYAGQRFNHENDVSTPFVNGSFTNWSGKYNSFDARGDHRADVSSPDASLTGTWSVGYSVGWDGNHNEAIAYAGDQEFWGLHSNTPTSGLGFSFSPSTYPAGYVSNKSRAGTNVGNGDYHLTSSSLSLNKVASGFSTLPYDLDGNPRRNDGTGAAGAYESDVTAPTVTSISSDHANGTFTVGEVIDIDVTFSEVVTSTGNVTVTLETGTTDRTCTFTVTSSTSGTCNYTVQTGDTTLDLTVLSIAGTIADSVANAMSNFVPVANLALNKALVIDTTAPTLSTISPADNATDVSITANLALTFTKVISDAGTGTVTIRKTSDDSIVEVIAVTGSLVTGSGTTEITVNPSVTLANATAYDIRISASAFPDTAGNTFAGISDATTWNFTTVAAAASSSSSSSTSSTTDSGGGTTGGGGGGSGGRRGTAATPQTGITGSPDTSGSVDGESDTTSTGLSRDGFLFITPQDSPRPILFKDVPTLSWFATFVAELVQKGIVSGYKDADGNYLGLFGPADPVTYAEIAKMALEAAGFSPDTSAVPENRSARRHWASDYIALAERQQLSIYTDSLNIDLPATRGEVIQTLLQVFAITLDTTITSAFKDLRPTNPSAEAITTAARLGIITGDTDRNGIPKGTVRPNDPINRAEVAKIISQLLEDVSR